MAVTKIDLPLQALLHPQTETTMQTEEDIQQQLAAESARLARQLGLQNGSAHHFRRPVERAFTAQERGKVTILFGGLTWKHEKVIQAVFEASGYRCVIMPVPNVAAFQLGKEYGNNGQCNPTYFTVGNLVQYLQRLEARGMSRQEIIDGHVFFTAGSCGPCRLGMYDYKIYSVEELVSLTSVNNVPFLRPFLSVIVGVAVLIGAAVASLSMYMAIQQRTREIGILKALGASKFLILRAVLLEALLLGLGGSIVGVGFSFLGRWLLTKIVPASLPQAIVPGWWPIAAAVAMGSAVLGALYPATLAARQDPIEAIAYE